MAIQLQKNHRYLQRIHIDFTVTDISPNSAFVQIEYEDGTKEWRPAAWFAIDAELNPLS